MHQGRIPTYAISGVNGISCDCLGLIIKVSQSLELRDRYGNLIEHLDITNYAADPSGIALRDILSNHLYLKNNRDINPGDLALISFANTPKHLAIIGKIKYSNERARLSLIHSYMPAGKVCEHILDAKWKNRIVSVFSFIKIIE